MSCRSWSLMARQRRDAGGVYCPCLLVEKQGAPFSMGGCMHAWSRLCHNAACLSQLSCLILSSHMQGSESETNKRGILGEDVNDGQAGNFTMLHLSPASRTGALRS